MDKHKTQYQLPLFLRMNLIDKVSTHGESGMTVRIGVTTVTGSRSLT